MDFFCRVFSPDLDMMRMNVASPQTAAAIKQSVQHITDALYASEFAQKNVDVQIDTIGILNYTIGVKLRLSYVDTFDDDDVQSWRAIAEHHGATGLKTRVNTSSGDIDLNIEYKKKTVKSQWLLRSAMLLLASWSYHQLHIMNEVRYPLPIEWLE